MPCVSFRYFVKVSWGWTLLLLTPFLLLSNSSLKRNVTFLGRRLLSLVVATVIWYVTTETFFYIEDLTGFCHETGAPEVRKENFTSKANCRRAGFHWNGWDISGHCFILTYSTLLIVEEMAPMVSLRTAGLEGGHRRQSALPRMVLSLLYVALNLIVIIWVWMFACTSVYFHDPLDKFLGTVCALLGWYLTYGVWYQRPMSPGLPPKIDPREDKRYA